jgi:hypothetical protein
VVDGVPGEQGEHPAAGEQREREREDPLVVAGQVRVVGPEDVLDEHVARVGANAQRERGPGGVATLGEGGGDQAQRGDEEQRHRVEPDRLGAQRAGHPVVDHAGDERAETGDDRQAERDREQRADERSAPVGRLGRVIPVTRSDENRHRYLGSRSADSILRGLPDLATGCCRNRGSAFPGRSGAYIIGQGSGGRPRWPPESYLIAS